MKRDSLQIQLKSLAEEMQAIIKGLEKVKQELSASENDGPVSEVFHKVSLRKISFKNLNIVCPCLKKYCNLKLTGLHIPPIPKKVLLA